MRAFLRLVAERLRIAIVAGITVGVVVAGLGSRLAMLVLRLTSDEAVDGVTSDDGFTIGEVTLAGTYNLMLVGAAVGVVGAVTYRAVAPWLLGPSWCRRLTVAIGAGVVVGAILVHTDGIDFRMLTPTWLAIGLFVLLPALFGWAMAVVVDRVAADDSWTRQGRRRWVLPVVLVVLFPFALFPVLVSAVAVVLWTSVPQGALGRAQRSVALRVVVRGAWLAVVVMGAGDLVQDVAALS